MNPDERNMLEETFRLAKENNEMLRSLKRSMIWGRVFSFLYWALIIGSAVGAYYYIQPYIDQMIGIYGGAKGNLESVNGIIEGFKNNLPR